jgi:hypothetical protein
MECPVGQEVNMDFIERIFGFSPDGGSGAFEVLLFVVPIVALAWIYVKRHRETNAEH